VSFETKFFSAVPKKGTIKNGVVQAVDRKAAVKQQSEI
jgi:hypothetical protein